MKKKFVIFFIIILIIIFYSLNSQEYLSFNNIKELALQNNLTLKNYENQMNLAKISYDQAVANLFFPSISVSSSTSIPFDSTKSSSASVNLSIQKPIFNGFTLRKAKDLALLNYQYKKNLYENQVQQTKYLSFKYYYQYLNKLLNERLYYEIMKINEKRMAEYKAKFDLSLITELDYTSLALTFSKVQISYENAKNEKEIAYLNLKNFINMNVDFKIAEEQYLDNVDFNSLLDNQDYDYLISKKPQDLLNDAKNFDTTYLASLYNLLQSEVNLKYYLATLFPTLSSSFGISYSGIFNEGSFNFNDPSFTLSLTLSIDLDSLIPGSSKSLEKKALEKELENSRVNLLIAEKSLLLNLEQNFKTLQLNKKNKENAENSYKYASRGYQLAKDAFNLGQISVSDFASWEEEYINAKISLYSSILSYILSIESIKAMIGKIQ